MGNPSTSAGSRILNLPFTKTTGHHSAKIILSRQYDTSDPIRWLLHHREVNGGDLNVPIFSYRKGAGRVCLTRTTLMQRCNAVWQSHGLPSITGHSFRIGGTTELLMCGVAPDIMKIMGHWKSDVFLCYWRSLDIVAPLHSEFVSRRFN